jgi:hypothetical protein
MIFIFEIPVLIYLVKEYGLNLNLMAVSVPEFFNYCIIIS